MQMRKFVLAAAAGLAVAGMPAVAFASGGNGNKPTSNPGHGKTPMVMYVLRGTVANPTSSGTGLNGCATLPGSGFAAASSSTAPGCLVVNVLGSNFHNAFNKNDAATSGTPFTLDFGEVQMAPKTHFAGLARYMAGTQANSSQVWRVVVKVRAPKGLNGKTATDIATLEAQNVFQIIFQGPVKTS